MGTARSNLLAVFALMAPVFLGGCEPRDDFHFAPSAKGAGSDPAKPPSADVAPPPNTLNCSAAAPSPATLWPPNHAMVPIAIDSVSGGAAGISITSISQDEPVNGLGDGNTEPDADGIGTSLALLRAERSGTGDGRVYHVSFNAWDGVGNTCSGTVTVCVPHDQAACNSENPHKDPTTCGCIDGGALYPSDDGSPVCVSAGDACSADSVCCDGSSCNSGACCFGDGAACDANADCCGGACVEGVCDSGTGEGGAGGGGNGDGGAGGGAGGGDGDACAPQVCAVGLELDMNDPCSDTKPCCGGNACFFGFCLSCEGGAIGCAADSECCCGYMCSGDGICVPAP